MSSEHDSNREREIFQNALDIAAAQERLGYVKGACGGDAALLDRVLDLLRTDEEAAGILPDTNVTPAPVIEQAGDRIGRYKLLQKLGEGGCGVVYMAEQQEPVHRRVALKIIRLGMDTPSVIARFEAERQALALMDHSNIARVLDAGATESGRPYFVMDLVQGIPLTRFCDEAQLDTGQRLLLFIQVCSAIQHAHQKGVIHRDIKPSNVLVTLIADEPVAKVIDFGIAKSMQQRLTDKTLFTQFHQFIGTPAYMSPEQTNLSGVDLDTRSDVYALGVLLYELLTGKTPFDSKALLRAGYEGILRIIREVEPPKPSTRLSTLQGEELTTAARRRRADPKKLGLLVRGDLDWIVMKCLEKDRTRRYETVSALANDIRRHLNTEPVTARPPSTAYKVHKFIRRNRLLAAAGGAVFAALTFGLALSSWLYWRESKARERAVSAEREQTRLTAIEKDLRQKAEAETARAVAAEQEEARLSTNQMHLRQKLEYESAQTRRAAYAADMNLAQLAWEQNSVARMRQDLERAWSYADRGFEWHYWDRKIHSELRTFYGHSQALTCITFSPDAAWIATGSRDGTVKVWDAKSGSDLHSFELRLPAGVGSPGRKSPVSALAFAPDGKRLAIGTSLGQATIWEVVSGRELLALCTNLPSSVSVNSIGFSHDGQRIFAGTDVGWPAKLWQASTGRESLAIDPAHSDTLTASGEVGIAAYSADGQKVATTGSGKGLVSEPMIRVWDATGGRLLETLRGHHSWACSMAFSPDGDFLVSGNEDGTADVWDLSNDRELLTLRGHAGPVWAVAFGPDSQRIITGSGDTTAKVWERSSGRELLVLKGHTQGIRSVAFSPDGLRVATASDDATARLWDAPRTDAPVTNLVWAIARRIALSADGEKVARTTEDGAVRVTERASGAELVTFSAEQGQNASVSQIAFSPDGGRVAAGRDDGTVDLFDLVQRQQLVTLRGHTQAVSALAFSRRGDQMVTGGADARVEIWDLQTGSARRSLPGLTRPVNAVAFSPNGQQIATCGFDGITEIWESSTGKELRTIHVGKVVSGVAFAPDGKWIVTGVDKRVRVWEVATGQELLALSGHDFPISSVAVSPDGHRIITGDQGGVIKVWDASGGWELLTLQGKTAPVQCFGFSSDGLRLVTASINGSVALWDATPRRLMAGTEAEQWHGFNPNREPGEFPAPPYPWVALRNHWKGTAALNIVVGPDGLPLDVELARSSGIAELDRNTADWVKDHWRWPTGDTRYLAWSCVYEIQ